MRMDPLIMAELNNLTLYKLMTTFEKVMERFVKNENEAKHTVIQYPFTIEEEQEQISKSYQIKAYHCFY